MIVVMVWKGNLGSIDRPDLNGKRERDQQLIGALNWANHKSKYFLVYFLDSTEPHKDDVEIHTIYLAATLDDSPECRCSYRIDISACSYAGPGFSGLRENSREF